MRLYNEALRSKLVSLMRDEGVTTAELNRTYGVSQTTLKSWKKRDSIRKELGMHGPMIRDSVCMPSNATLRLMIRETEAKLNHLKGLLNEDK